VPREVLEDLVKIGITAPSGSNCQMWAFTILPDRLAVDMLGEAIGDFYRTLNRMAAKGWLRRLLKIIGKPELDRYHRNHYDKVQDALAQWDSTGRDLLFHGASAAIVVSSNNQASCPAEDALLATQNILLGAHSMGLGTCLIGFAIEAMKRDQRINRLVRLPEDETPYSVIALGYPAETYQMVTGRKPAAIRLVETT